MGIKINALIQLKRGIFSTLPQCFNNLWANFLRLNSDLGRTIHMFNFLFFNGKAGYGKAWMTFSKARLSRLQCDLFIRCNIHRVSFCWPVGITDFSLLVVIISEAGQGFISTWNTARPCVLGVVNFNEHEWLCTLTDEKNRVMVWAPLFQNSTLQLILIIWNVVFEVRCGLHFATEAPLDRTVFG